MKSIILCADDFGQNDEISSGIIELLSQQRITATSCMTNLPNWPSHGAVLKQISPDAAIGLHFNLTHGQALSAAPSISQDRSFFSLNKLLLRCFARHILIAAVEEEFKAQLESFKNVFGRYPDFIDGHQHVHQFPVIRDAFLNIYQQTFKQQRPYIRQVLTTEGPYAVKRFIINHTGASTFKQHLRQLSIVHNTSFAGIYDFHPQSDYPTLFKRFLTSCKDNGLIMCHPALAPEDASDKIAHARFKEYRYLISDRWIKDCEEQAIRLTPHPNPLFRPG